MVTSLKGLRHPCLQSGCKDHHTQRGCNRAMPHVPTYKLNERPSVLTCMSLYSKALMRSMKLGMSSCTRLFVRWEESLRWASHGKHGRAIDTARAAGPVWAKGLPGAAQAGLVVKRPVVAARAAIGAPAVHPHIALQDQTHLQPSGVSLQAQHSTRTATSGLLQQLQLWQLQQVAQAHCF